MYSICVNIYIYTTPRSILQKYLQRCLSGIQDYTSLCGVQLPNKKIIVHKQTNKQKGVGV